MMRRALAAGSRVLAGLAAGNRALCATDDDDLRTSVDQGPTESPSAIRRARSHDIDKNDKESSNSIALDLCRRGSRPAFAVIR